MPTLQSRSIALESIQKELQREITRDFGTTNPLYQSYDKNISSKDIFKKPDCESHKSNFKIKESFKSLNPLTAS